MSIARQVDVLVAGAGPTGLLAALSLAEAGLSVELVDEEWRPAGHSYALALHPRSLGLLDQLGVLKDAMAEGRKLPSLTISGQEETGPQLVRCVVSDERFPFLLALPQSTLERLLSERLAKQGVRVRWSHRVAALDARGDHVAATVQRLEKESSGYAVAHSEWAIAETIPVRARFVIGADGHRSLVRKALGTTFEETGASQAFAIFECDAPGAGDEMQLVMGSLAISVLWPLPGQRARWSLEITAPDVSAADRYKSRLTTMLGERYFPYLDETQTRDLLRERAPWFEKAAGRLGWSVEVRFERRLAACFGAGRIWLAGDAAHLTGPVGMQSMNSGLAEAGDLAARIARIHSGRGGLDLLTSYGIERREQWEFLLGLRGRLRPTPSAPLVVARNASRLLPCLPATGDEMALYADQLGLVIED